MNREAFNVPPRTSMAIPSLARVERAICSRPGGLYQFARLAWHAFEESTLIPGWHLEEICAHLEAVSRGEIDRLVINVPPGASKSSIVSVIWQAWDWGPGRRPDRKYMGASFDMDLSRRDSMRAKGLVSSSWYQDRWGISADPRELEDEGLRPVYIPRAKDSKQDTASIWYSSLGGFRFATSVGGKATGWHAHVQIVDDPTNPTLINQGGKQAIKQLDSDWRWYSGTMSTRKADPDWFARVIIMQRLHAADIAGRCIEEGYTHLCLPMEFDSKRRCLTPWGGDRRKVEGELLQPGRFGAEGVTQLKKDLGPIQAAAQLAQDPAPESGMVYERAWFGKTFRHLPVGSFQFIQSWDFTFKNTSDSDYVVGVQWAWGQGKFYLLDGVREKAGFLQGLHLLKSFVAKWSQVNHKILIEDKANGTAIIEVLDSEIPGIIPYSPTDSKPARANATSGYWQAGDILIQEDFPFAAELITEHTQFPRGAHDDIIDASNQGLLYMGGKMRPNDRLSRAMANAFPSSKLPGASAFPGPKALPLPGPKSITPKGLDLMNYLLANRE